ncbi:MAG: hypothetical protein A2V70_06990 [Planctomycetes bacterium RBG_13_63_9]|nr:MAG: hypothetical protein A2V70_06990 [Planctomycetes bacterium RBG_13_63_9]
MHTVEILQQALGVAEQLGYKVRHEWLGGDCGGGCELNGRKIFFLDLALDPSDQLDQVVDTLRREPDALRLPMAAPLRGLLGLRRSA